MLAQKLQVKIPLAPTATVTPRDLVPVFHRFIQTKRLPEIAIDVADYAHVPDGPGVLLICHAANYALDSTGGRPGLLYSRKRDADGDFPARVAAAFRAALSCARELSGEPALAGKLAFATDALLFRIMDRLHAPNDAATFLAVKPALDTLGLKLYGGPVTLAHAADPAQCFSVELRGSAAPDVAQLLERIA